jgi:hypothetical protein
MYNGERLRERKGRYFLPVLAAMPNRGKGFDRALMRKAVGFLPAAGLSCRGEGFSCWRRPPRQDFPSPIEYQMQLLSPTFFVFLLYSNSYVLQFLRRIGSILLQNNIIRQKKLYNTVAFYAVAFYSVTFYAVAFITVTLFAAAFYAVAFYAVAFYAVAFYAVVFYAVAFITVALYAAAFYAVALYAVAFYAVAFYAVV